MNFLKAIYTCSSIRIWTIKSNWFTYNINKTELLIILHSRGGHWVNNFPVQDIKIVIFRLVVEINFLDYKEYKLSTAK